MPDNPKNSRWTRFGWKWLRGLLIAAITWFIASAVFAPMLNPLLRGYGFEDAENQSLMGFGWAQLVLVRQDLQAYVQREHVWPNTLRDAGLVEIAGPFDIEINAAKQLRVTVSMHLSPESGLRGTQALYQFHPETQSWSCRPGTPAIPDAWLPVECRASMATARNPLLMLLLACVIFLLLSAAWLWWQHPALSALQKRPDALARLPLHRLAKTDQILRWTLRRNALLQAADVALDDWQDAINFASASVAYRAQTLALRLGVQAKPSDGWSLPGRVFEWRLPQSFPLGLERCFAYFPHGPGSGTSNAAGLNGIEIVRHLRGIHAAQDVLLIFSADPALEAPLRDYASDAANLAVLSTSANQSELLLAPQASTVLLRILVQQLKVTRISPYQTRGGIARPSAFFGRAQLLTRIVGREPNNYLVVGGRQLGKTSLLKAIERQYLEHPRVKCHYISLRDQRLTVRLAMAFGLPESTSLTELIGELARQAKHRRLLLLIDEADLFVRADAQLGYPELTSLRALSEQGLAHFVLAGFWDVYEAVVLDYHSPLRNFGEPIQIGALEVDACTRMVTEPLAQLALRFANAELIQLLITQTGQRANLIAIACQQCLENLSPGQRVIDAPALQAALSSGAVSDALQGWSRLSPNDSACRLDRIVVYLVARDGATQLTTVMLALKHIDAEAIRRSLLRLQLAFVLKRAEDQYEFAVPLIAAQFQPSEVQALLAQELAAMASSKV